MVTIRLLGPPAIERTGRPARPPRGRKAWALLCYLLLTERPPSRRRLAEMLFGDADDPLGALRWTLAELRRALGVPGVLGGDPVVTALDGEVIIDVHLLTDESGDPAGLLDLDGELLEGVHLAALPEFESWLLVERHRVSAALEARLHETAVALLAAGRADEAVAYASRAVAVNPLEERNHEVLVRSLAVTGDRTAALRQVAVCEDILRRELAIDASPALREASEVDAPAPMAPPLGGRAAAVSQLEAGRAAIAAGAVDAGLQCLRRAVTEAARCRDDALRGRALAALGGALVHAVRGRDEEGSVLLHQAIALAVRAGDRATAVTAHRQLGFVEVQAGRRRTADAWLAKARALADGDQEIAAILGVRGMNASDLADYPAALAHLEESVERAARCADHRQQAWSLSILARAHLLRAEHSQAAVALARSLEMVREQRWMAFLPLPQVLQAELDLNGGDVRTAADGFEQAWTLACQLGDPCWEGMAARGLGLVHAARGDSGTAMDWFTQAVSRCTKVSDRYQWVHGYVLDAMIATALDRDGRDRAGPLVAALALLAARCEMREFVVRAHLYRHRLGDRTALASARLLGADIDNPALTRLLGNRTTGRTK
ncbi:DNA-binding transcriptional activator of the SARP family [Thermomonospora echinospora]|uniref:DNA-binding transcriptional activator of the SARP family n=1 Tax=Thermomonospora echinospora TaxID=1992 RepID=A0A1H5XW94_9ACTN|nr:BTAD domain-containing putative transcriptional regulator [Thermomonospora echinospora]SEG15805.1 DNA-binding transcriptional activator of the SARP family [Thermomonospora echinospora]